jgi:rare lipoprotein A
MDSNKTMKRETVPFEIRYPRYRAAARALVVLLLPLVVIGCSSVPLPPDPAMSSAAVPPGSASSSLPALPPAGSGRGGYYLDDGPGDAPPEGLAATPDAEPRVEPYFKRGNQPYVVFGKSYRPFTDDRPYKERGIGSWYGKKFHGQRTSSGELYDMYKMTAAHPTLPLPSYVRVTNLANGKQVIVRVNDRGPFHPGRVIDLSYTAALKLGYLGQGRAEVEVERLLPEEINRMAKARAEADPPASPVAEPVAVALHAAPVVVSSMPGFYLQLGAYAEAVNAEAARARLMQGSGMVLPPLQVVEGGSLHRVYGGPFATRAEAELAAQHLQKEMAVTPLIVQR